MKFFRIFFPLALLFVLLSNFSPLVERDRLPKKFQLAYTTAQDSNAITPINLRTGVAGRPICLEHHPRSVAISPDTAIAYILQQGSNEIIPVDLKTGKAAHPIVLERNPQSMVIAPEGKKSYVIYEDSNQIHSIELETGSSEVLIALEKIPSRMALAPDGEILYVSYEALSEITSIERISGSIKSTISLNDVPRAMAVTDDGRLVYIEDSSSEKMLFYHLETGLETEALIISDEYDHLKTRIQNINISPDGKTAYLIEEDSNEIITVNLRTQLMSGAINLEHPINSMAIYPMLTGDTSTTLNSSANPAVFGESITLKASVTSLVDTGVPTGTVLFVDTVLGTIGMGTLDMNGNATFTTSTLAIGPHTLSANYGGDSNYNPSSSAPFLQDVNQALTTTVVASSTNPSFFGNSVTFTATVAITTPGMGTPTGSVDFYDGTTFLGSGTLSGSAPYQADFSASNLVIGSHTISAVYSGDGNFITSTSPSLTQTISQGTTSTSVGTSQTPLPFGDSVTFTATITVTNGTGTPTGTVTFKNGSTILGTQPISAGTATFSTNALIVGSHTITATYNGNADFTGSSSSNLTQMITQGTTNTAVVSSVSPSTYGQQIDFTATVSIATGAGIPTGNVTFKDGTTVLGMSAINGSGIATLSIANLSVNTHSITAVYNGDTNFLTSTSLSLSQIVNKAVPQVTVTSSLSPSNYGDLVTFTATVAIINPPTKLGLPSGSVSFYNGATFLGTGTLNGIGPNTATATFALSALNAGTHSITAQYSGDTNFTSLTSSQFSQIVNKVASTAINLFINSPNPTEYGETVNLSVSVTGSTLSPPLPPTGTVSFYDGSTLIGTGTLSPVIGNPNSSTATFPISTLAIGSHVITAQYEGDINYPSSPISSPKTQKIVKSATSSVVISSVNPSVFEQDVTFTVTVNAISPATGAPSGTVAFYDGADFLGNSSSLSPGTNSSTATFSTSTLNLGTHYILGIYKGDSNFTASSAPTVTQIVNMSNTTTQITSSSSSPSGFEFGDFITFNANVTANSPGSGTPTGTVEFFDGSTSIGTGTLSGGVATVTTVNLTPGIHSITSIYNGDANFTASISSIFSQTIKGTLPTTTTIVSQYIPSASGSAVTYQVTVVANPGTGQGTPSTIPTGTIVLTDTSNTPPTILSGTLINGVAYITEPGNDLELETIAPATHQITAAYSGDLFFDSSSTATPFSQVVVPFNTSTTLVVMPDFPGQPTHSTQAGATLIATVNSFQAHPSFSPIPPFPSSPQDTVSFYAGTIFLGTAPLVPGVGTTGTATLMPINLPFGTEALIAVFSGDDTSFATSTSPPVNLQVQQTAMITTTTTLTSSLTNSIFCQPVTFTTTVASDPSEGFYSPTGTVTFFANGVEVGGSILVPATGNTSVAQLTLSDLPVGTYPMTATYNSDSNYAFSFSNTITQTVSLNNTALTLSIIPNLPSNTTPYGENVIMSATVTTTTPYVAIPTGTVTFSYGTTVLGTVDIDITGEAVFQIDNLDVGTYLITATYNPDPCFTSSKASQSYSIGQIKPTTTFSSSPNPSIFGEVLFLEATVTSAVGTPTGSVTFYNGSTALETVFLEGGIASLEIASPLAGFDVLKGTYNGNTNFLVIDTPSKLQIVNKAPTSTCLVSYTTNPSVYGELVTLNATVSSLASDISPGITGNVTFMNGTTLIGTVPLNGCDSAVLETTNLNLGSSNSIVATYSGDSNFATSTSSSLSLTVIKSETSTAVTSIIPTSPTFGSLVTFNVNVTALSPGSGIPTGTVTGYYGSKLIGTGTLINGVASFSPSPTTILPVGVQTIIVKYSGDTNFIPSQGTATVTVAAVATLSTITSSVSTSSFGQPVTFNVAVTSTQGTPAGTVAFLDGTTTLATQTLNSNGTASFATSSLGSGSHSIKVVYSGSTNFSSSTTSTITQVVDQDATTTTLTSSLNPAVYGDTITLTAHVFGNNPGAGMPTGTIMFKNGSTVIGSGILDASGQATLTVSTSLVASATPYSIVAVYSGDGNFTSSTGAFNQTINKAATAVVASFTPNPASYGLPVILNVTVAPIDAGAGIPSGTVVATYGSQNVGSGTLSNSGSISFQTINLPAGTLGIIIQYLGDNNFLPSTLPLTGTVNQANSTTTISSSAIPSSVFGEPVIFSVNVVSSAEQSVTPTGIVTFFDGSSIIGTQSLDSFGNTTLTTSILSEGSHSITAVYSGDTTNNGSAVLFNQIVSQDTTTTTLSSILNPSVYGESITFRAVINANGPGSGIPTGTVTFQPIGTVVALNSNGEALLTVSSLPVGSNPITANYSGDINFSSSTTTLTQNVVKAPTITSVTSAANPSNFGNTVSISGTVIPLNNGSTILSSGTIVTAYYGATSVGLGALNADGQYAFSLSGLPAGTLAIEVKYPGDANFDASTITLTQTVNVDSSTTTLLTTPNPSIYGQPVTLTSKVILASGGIPTGTVTYYDGPVAIGIKDVNQPLVISTLSPGIHSLTAVYSGSTNTSGSTSSVASQIVNQNIPLTTVFSNLNPSIYGENVTFTATVTSNPSGSGLPTGFVTFYFGDTVLGSGQLNAGGQAIFSISSLPQGSNPIKAVYSGDTNFGSSTSSTLTQVVNVATTTTTIVTSIPNPSVFGQSVRFFANVSSPAGTPTGTVTFYEGTTSLGTAPLYDGSAIFSISNLSIGSHTITAMYNGGTNFSTSSSLDYSQIVILASTVTTVTNLSSSKNPSFFGDPVEFTVQIVPSVMPVPPTLYPTGFVTLYTGSTPLATLALDSTGGASYTTSTLPAGNLEIVAFYSGDTQYSASTALITQTVHPIASTTSLDSSENPSNFGDTVTFAATVYGGPGYPTPTGSISFYDGATLLDTVLLNDVGIANFVTSSLSTGYHTIQAVYNGNSNYETSISTLTQVVNLDATATVVLISLPNPSNIGESVSFIASTTAIHGMPTGLVTFYDGTIPLGTMSLFDGIAIFSTSSLTIGLHSITASYAGNENYSPSVSPPHTQQVIDESAILRSPRGFCGCQVIHKGECRTDRVNILKWKAPGVGAEPQYYEIYRNADLTDRIAVIPACAQLRYKDHHRRKGKAYTYYLVAVNQDSVSPAVSVTVKPRRKHCSSREHLANKKGRHVGNNILNKNFPNFNERPLIPRK